MKLPEFSVKQPVAITMLFGAILIIGIFSLLRLNLDIFPDISPPVVSILTTWPGASASDVETEVSKEIEDEVNVVSNLDTLTSKSLDNLSVVICKFDWGTSLDVATNDIRDKLELAKELEANFVPIVEILQAGLTTPIKKKKLCQSLEFFAVTQATDPPSVLPLFEAIKPLIKAASAS